MLKDRLVKLRNEKGLSQYEAADRLGYSRGKLSNYEQGSRQPDNKTLKELADFYDVTTDYLLGRSDDSRLSEKEQVIMIEEMEQILHVIESWPKDKQKSAAEQILTFAKYLANVKKGETKD